MKVICNKNPIGKKLFLLMSLSVFSAAGHENVRLGKEQRQLIISVYEKASALDPEIFHLSRRPGVARAHTLNNGGINDWDSSFRDLIRGWIRLFRHEVERDCPCHINENELIKEVPHIPRSWFYFYRQKIMNKFYGHLIEGSDLGAKYGKTFFYMKVSLEAMETALSFVIGGLGVHIACNAIDVLVFFIARKAQTYSMVFHGGKTLDQNRALMIARLAWMRRQQKKAVNKARFHLKSALIHPEALERVNKTGRKNNRRKWLKKLSSRIAPLLAQIQQIETRLDDQNLTGKERKKLKTKKQRLYQQAGRLTEISRKDFFGNRYKRYFWLRSRKGKSGHLNGHGIEDQAVSYGKKGIWPIGVEENILNPVFTPASEEVKFSFQRENISDPASHFPAEEVKDSPTETVHTSLEERAVSPEESALFESSRERAGLTDLTQSFFHRMEQTATGEHRHPAYKADEIRRGLAEEFSEKVRKEMKVTNKEKHIKAVEYVLRDIEKIFDPSVSMKERHNLAFEMEMILTGFFGYYLQVIFEELLPKSSSLKDRMKVRWKLSLFLRHSYIYADSLFTVSLIKDPSVLFSYKYEAMENLLTLLEYLHKLSLITQGERQETPALLARLDQNLHPLQVSPFLEEKKTAFSLIPFKPPTPPTCHDLMRKEN